MVVDEVVVVVEPLVVELDDKTTEVIASNAVCERFVPAPISPMAVMRELANDVDSMSVVNRVSESVDPFAVI